MEYENSKTYEVLAGVAGADVHSRRLKGLSDKHGSCLQVVQIEIPLPQLLLSNNILKQHQEKVNTNLNHKEKDK